MVYLQQVGHYIFIYGYENGYLKIYDPYLYSGKFNTSTRKGKAIVQGNTVLVTPSNFKAYANAKSFFIYTKTNNTVSNQNVSTASYDATVKVNSSLRVRNSPNGTVVGKISNGTNVTVYEISGNWAKIGDNRWISLDYIVKAESKLGTYYVSVGSLRLRTEHNLNSKKYVPNGNIITYLYNDTYLNIQETWTYVDQLWGRAPQGWVCLSSTAGTYMKK